jgi:hypothetical protein
VLFLSLLLVFKPTDEAYCFIVVVVVVVGGGGWLKRQVLSIFSLSLSFICTDSDFIVVIFL